LGDSFVEQEEADHNLHPGFKSWLEIWLRFLLHLRPITNSAIISTLTAHCQWEDEAARERTGNPPSYAKAKKMKSLTLHTHGCPRASLRDYSSTTSSSYMMCTSNDECLPTVLCDAILKWAFQEAVSGPSND